MTRAGKGDSQAASAFLQTAAAPEKRVGRRYPVVVPVVIRWKDTEDDHEVSGVLRDVNDFGIFFYADATIPAGARVELVFTVPRELTAPETFRFTGTLIRTENAIGKEKGFAIQVNGSELLGELRSGQAFEGRTLDAEATETGATEPVVAQPDQPSRHSRFRLIAVIGMFLGASALFLAFAANGIMARQQEARSRASAARAVQVWIDPSTGTYHCPGSAWYGKKSGGKYVTQKQAQLDGFQPAYQRPCEVAPSRGEDR